LEFSRLGLILLGRGFRLCGLCDYADIDLRKIRWDGNRRFPMHLHCRSVHFGIDRRYEEQRPGKQEKASALKEDSHIKKNQL